MTEEHHIHCHPPSSPFWQLVVAILGGAVVFGAMILAGLVIAYEFLMDSAPSGQTKLGLMGVSVGISAVLLLLFIRWEQDRWYWTLTGEALMGGKKRSRRYPLDSIALIVPGLPEKTHLIVEANKLFHPALWQSLVQERRLALLLKFADGSFMPLHVHRCVEGRTLMSELIRRLAARIDPNYVYTEREVKALRAADWNRVVHR